MGQSPKVLFFVFDVVRVDVTVQKRSKKCAFLESLLLKTPQIWPIPDPTPTLTGGELKSWTPGVSERYSIMVLKNGKIVEQLFRRGINGSAAFIDQLTFLISKQSCANLFTAAQAA